MKIYTLHGANKIPRNGDGQLRVRFRPNIENNVSKVFDQLYGICAGILSDGAPNIQEADFFSAWLKRAAMAEPVWPFTELQERLESLEQDNLDTNHFIAECAILMRQILGDGPANEADETLASQLPLDQPPPWPVLFEGKTFIPTGRFAIGSRQKITELLRAKGASVQNGFPNHTSDYLVIGQFASRDWYHTNYGRKIERAVELRTDGVEIAVISESHLKNFLL